MASTLLSSDASYVDGTLISNSLMFLCFQTLYLPVSIYRYLIGILTLTWQKKLDFFPTNTLLSSSSFLVKGTTAITIYRVASEDNMKDSWCHLFSTPFCLFSSSSGQLSPYPSPLPAFLCSSILDLLFTLMTSLFICFQQTNFLKYANKIVLSLYSPPMSS